MGIGQNLIKQRYEEEGKESTASVQLAFFMLCNPLEGDFVLFILKKKKKKEKRLQLQQCERSNPAQL